MSQKRPLSPQQALGLVAAALEGVAELVGKAAGSGRCVQHGSAGSGRYVGLAPGPAQKEGHRPTADYVAKLREVLPAAFPSVGFSFLPADMSTQVLNFGSPAPIDVQVTGPDQNATYAYAQRLENAIKHVPGVADVGVFQRFDYPMLNIDVDRGFAQMVGLTQGDVAHGLLDTLPGSKRPVPGSGEHAGPQFAGRAVR